VRRLGGRQWSRAYRRASLVIETQCPFWFLFVRTATSNTRLTVCSVRKGADEDPAELRAVAMRLAEQTGWSLDAGT
jgi:hypothetical protein